MSDIIEIKTLEEIQDEHGNVIRKYPITREDAIIGLKARIREMTKDIGDLDEKIVDAIALLAHNPYLIDEVDGRIYRISMRSGKLHYVEVDSGVDEVMNPEE